MQFTRPVSAAACFLLALTCVAANAPRTVERVERGNLVLEDVPPIDPALALRLERYLGARQATLRDWTPQGALIITTRFGEVDQLHLVEQPFGLRRQLTFSSEPVGLASHSPTGARAGFVFLQDIGGNENTQIWFQPLNAGAIAGEPRRLTDGRSLNGSVRWSNDGTRIAYYSNVRAATSYDVYVQDPLSDAPPQLVLESGGHAWYPLDWSPDDTRLLLWNVVAINDNTVWVADLAAKSLTQLDVSQQRVGISQAAFARDGRGVYMISDRGSDFRHLRYVPLDGSPARVLTAHIPWDIEGFDLSRDGRYLAYTANVDGYSRLVLHDLIAQKDLPVPDLPAGTIANPRFDPAGARLAFGLETARAPRDVFVFDIAAGKVNQWTQSEVGPLDSSRFVDAQLVRYPTFDSTVSEPRVLRGRIPDRVRVRTIPAFVHRPAGPGPHPVVISIHGGPESQYRPEFDSFVQFVVNELGYAVIAPNVRGSSGYGRSYLNLDNGFRREDAVRDIGALLEWIRRHEEFDRRRVIAMGASYGGYMTLAALVKYSDHLAGGVDAVGISNYISFLANTSEYRRDLRRAEYGDERNERMREFLHSISPLTHAERIRKPLLVVQGANDPRVPASESEQMVARIRAIGGDVWYLLARDEGHGFKRKQNRDAYWETVATFLARHGRQASAPPPAAAEDD